MPAGDVDKEPRHEGGKAKVELTDDESAELERPAKVFAADRRGNDEAASSAARARGEPESVGLVDLDGEWKKAGGGGASVPSPAAASEEAGPPPGGLAAWGPPAPRVAEALWVLEDPAPWVRF